MKIYIGSDHAGFELKEKMKSFLVGLGYEVLDKGPYSYDALDDYPDFILPVAEAVAEDTGSRGIIFGMSGQGEAMAANRVKGARAALYYGGNLDIVKLSREHNNANILSFGAKMMTDDEVKEALNLWLDTPFSGEERHVRRINKF